MKRFGFAVLTLLWIFTVGTAVAADGPGRIDPGPFFAPDARGPHEVGVATTYFVDGSRYETWGECRRILPVEVWYPSTGLGGMPNAMPQMVGPMPDWTWGVFDHFWGESFDAFWSLTTSALRNAEVLSAPGPYPVVLFSHGLTAIRFQNYTLCEHLASHGFIVVAPDHYGNAIFTNIPLGGIIPFNPAGVVASFFDRIKDVRFVFESLEAMNGNPENPFFGLLDLDHFALSGHSYGGVTSLAAGLLHDFVKAIAPLNPAWAIGYPASFSKPFFLLRSEWDTVVGEWDDAARVAFDDAGSEHKLYLNFLRGGHYSATDACPLLPPGYISPSSTGCGSQEHIDFQEANALTSAYLTAFLKSAMLGDVRYDDYLSENHAPGEIELITTFE